MINQNVNTLNEYGITLYHSNGHEHFEVEDLISSPTTTESSKSKALTDTPAKPIIYKECFD